jgi:glycosyltransferase involved in cell wall biosynthesis
MHDLAFLNNGSGLKRYVIKKLFLDLPVRRLKFITAVSEATRQAAITHTGCPPEKIRVIHDPVQEHYLNGSPKSFNKERPTILQIGITENKNIPRLIKALEGINCRVVIVGNMTDDLAAQLEAGRIDYTSVLGLDDQAMRKAYEAADIVSFCSTFEGFGLPIIEAQSMMTPVLTSDLEPMKEVSGGAAYLADPYDIESIRQGILTMINDDGFRERIISEGLVNVQRFLPHKIAAKYQELYDEVLQDANRPIGSQDRNSMNA